MDIDNVGPAIIQQLYNGGFINNALDLYKLTMQDFMQLEGVKEKSAYNMFTSIQESKSRPLNRLITALGIKHIGKEYADVLTQNFQSIEAIINADKETLAQIEGFGAKIADSVYEFFHDEKNLNMLKELRELGINLTIQNSFKSNKLNGKIFVLTGTLQNMTRDEASEIIKQNGGKTSSSVSKKTDFVLAGDNAGSKLDKAQNLGVIILSEEDFMKMLKD